MTGLSSSRDFLKGGLVLVDPVAGLSAGLLHLQVQPGLGFAQPPD